jgi:hypothetical protein
MDMTGIKKYISMIVTGMVLVFIIAGCVSNKNDRTASKRRTGNPSTATS